MENEELKACGKTPWGGGAKGKGEGVLRFRNEVAILQSTGNQRRVAESWEICTTICR